MQSVFCFVFYAEKTRRRSPGSSPQKLEAGKRKLRRGQKNKQSNNFLLQRKERSMAVDRGPLLRSLSPFAIPLTVWRFSGTPIPQPFARGFRSDPAKLLTGSPHLLSRPHGARPSSPRPFGASPQVQSKQWLRGSKRLLPFSSSGILRSALLRYI